jgi:hypothetical protein
MTVQNPANREQVVALQTLYAMWARHAVEASSDPRGARLAWASESVGRQIDSFSDLNRDEARQLIDRLKGSMGQPLTRQPEPWRHIRSRERAQAAGTEGRRGAEAALIQMASPDDLARIDQALSRLGWTRDRYEAWLRSARSPLKDRGSATIRTVGEANKVWWALKNMLKRSGDWRPARKRVRQALQASI